jgi:hypothetical protein
MTQEYKVYQASVAGCADPEKPFQCKPPNNPATCRQKSDWTCWEILEKLKDLFVNRSDCYCIQLQTGGYLKITEPLTDEKLKDHLNGKTTVGTYQISLNNLVKWICFDIDPEKTTDPRTVAKSILSTLRAKIEDQDGQLIQRIWDNSIILEASRYPDNSIHIWVLFKHPVKAKIARWLANQLLALTDVNPKTIEIFPKQNETTPERPYGNFVKLPFGKHQVEQKFSRLLDLDTFEPQPLTSLAEKQGLTFNESDLTEMEHLQAKTDVQTRFQSAPIATKTLDGISIQQTAEFLAKYWRKGYRNELTLSFCGYCIKKGYSYQTAKEVIRQVCKLTDTTSFDTSEFLQKVDYQYRYRKNIGSLKGISGIREIIQTINLQEGIIETEVLPL